MQVKYFHDQDKAQLEAEKREQLKILIADQNEKRRLEAKRRRLITMESAIAGDKRSDEERIQDEIDGVAEDIPDIVPAAKESRKRKDRPDNWKDSTDEAVVYRNILVYVDATSDADANADIESDEN